ncbi:MAG: hypothetical protein KGD63_01195 [Candidatus Lokiarchaeota archaeon]|nr:hypothetical protein [Candidatus Lokiarchaeota archaeon]
MSVILDIDLVLKKLLDELGEKVFFIIISSENGLILKSYINNEEFNKTAISLHISQVYESAEEITELIGVHNPDFNLIHSDNFYILSVKILNKIIIVLMEDQTNITEIFHIINGCIKTS